MFLNCLQARNLSHVLLSDSLYLIIGEPVESLKDFLNPRSVKKITYLPLLNRTKLDKKKFDELQENIRLYQARVEINKNTLLKFGKLWVKNQTKNLPHMTYSNDISRVFGKFKNIPGIIVSAGPSMEIVIPYIKKLKESFLILAVDTAVKSLIEEGIEPDFVMSIDAQYWNAKHLDGVITEKTILVADSSIQPSALRGFKNRIYFTKSTFPVGKYFEEKRAPFPKIASGGSVSTNIWDFALQLGLRELYFIGQDLGFPGFITHYKNSYFEKNMLICSNRHNPIETQSFNYIYSGFPTLVTSNSGKTIVSDKRMSIYIDWFKEKLKLNSINNCFNLSPNGCKIEGMPFRDINSLSGFPVIRQDITKILSLLDNRDNNKYLPTILKAALDFRIKLQEVVDLAKKALDLCKSIEYSYKKRLEINSLLDELTTLDRELVTLNHSATLSFIIEPFIHDVSQNDSETALEALLISKELYSKIIFTGSLHQKYLEQSINKMNSLVK